MSGFIFEGFFFFVRVFFWLVGWLVVFLGLVFWGFFWLVGVFCGGDGGGFLWGFLVFLFWFWGFCCCCFVI